MTQTQGQKRSREVFKLDDQIGGQEPAVSSSAKRARQNRIRVPFSCARQLFELTKELGFKRNGKTVEWLIQQSELDQDPHKFTSAEELLLINASQDKMLNTDTEQSGRQRATKDRHRLTEDGHDRRVRVPNKCVSQITELTEKLRLKSDGETIEWLFRKYWVSRTPPLQPIPSTTVPLSTSTIADTSFDDTYLSPENDSSIFPTGFSIPGHHHQQDLAAHYEQENVMEPAFNAHPKSMQYGISPPSHPYDGYLPPSSTEGTANQLQFPSYPQQQVVSDPNSMNILSWALNAGGLMTVNDGLIRERRSSTSESAGKMGSMQHNPYLYPQQGYGRSSAKAGERLVGPGENFSYNSYLYTQQQYWRSSAMARERLVGPAENLSYTEQIWHPYSTSSNNIAQSYRLQNQDWLQYPGINSNGSGISMNLAYPQQQTWYPSGGVD